MFHATFETLAIQEIQQVVCDLPDQMGGFEGKEVRKQFAPSISPKVRRLPDVSEDIENEWLLFKSATISSAAERCVQKRLRVAGDSEKRTPWWNQEEKKLFEQRKMRSRPCYWTDRCLICNPATLRREKRQFQQ